MSPQSKWGKYVPIYDDDSGMIDVTESISGSAYSDAYDKYMEGPDKNQKLFVPFAAWIDETGLTKKLRHPCQPLLINCLLAKREYQRNRLLAYVPCMPKSSAEKKRSAKNSNEDTPLQHHHSALKVIFRMFDNAASEFKKKKITVTLGGTVKNVFIVPVLLYMKGDHKSHQENTCRFGHKNGAICISCNRAAAWDADNSEIAIGEQIDATVLHKQNVEYSNISEQIDLLKELIADPNCDEISEKKEELKTNTSSLILLKKIFDRHSITPGINAFEEFSHLATSIYHCSPPDHLHVFLLGMLKYAADSTIGKWTDITKNEFEILARRIVHDHHSSSVRNQFPRYPMKRGLSNLSVVSGTEWVGFWFIVLIVGRTPGGSIFLQSTFDAYYKGVKIAAAKKKKKLLEEIESTETPDGPKCIMNKSQVKYLTKICNQSNPTFSSILILIEDLIIFHSSVFQKKLLWSNGKKQKWLQWVRNIIRQLPIIFPRVDGNSWKLPKMHLLSHIPQNIEIYGAPLNFDCTNGEHALQEFAKDLSKTVAKNTSIHDFNLNLAKRLQQHQIQQRYITEYTMTDCPFVKIITDMRKDRTNQRDQQQDWCLDPVLLNNEIETTHNEDPIFSDSNKKVYIAKTPNWSAHYVIKLFRIDGVVAKINDKEVYTLDQLRITVYDDTNSSRTIPRICQQELNRDVTQWLRETSNSKLKQYLPSLSSATGEEKKGKTIKIDCYYQAKFKYNNGDTHSIRCHPNFFQRGPRYDFVLQNHGNGESMQDKFGRTALEVTPSRLLVLYENPFDGELRAVLHGSKFEGEKTARLTETHTFEVRVARIKLDGLFFSNSDETPNEQTILRKFKNNNHPFRAITHVPNCFGAEMSLISGPQLVFLERNKLLNMYSSNYDKHELIFVLCRDNRKYWHKWMD